MPKRSAGLLGYRFSSGAVEVLLIHPGGPLWARKDAGAWSIPKGEVGADEDLLAAARREFEEETSFQVQGPFQPLDPIRLKSGKVVHAWAVVGDWDLARFKSNTFELEWPPRSGNIQQFPEADRARFCGVAEAQQLLHPAQVAFVTQLIEILWAQ